MRPSTFHPPADERGFILVGVVTFMLALTILGLSLFALSSYEAQFFIVSAAREQSLQNSESGMELVKALLAAPGKDHSLLEYAHRAEGQMGVTSAMAYQWRSADANDTTSTGPVDWNDSLVIVVAAKSGGVERTLQAKFMPGVTDDPYQRLIVAGQGISVNTGNPAVPQLTGRVWQPVASDADTAWTNQVSWSTGRPIERGTPPTPLVSAFVTSQLQVTVPPTASNLAPISGDLWIEFQGKTSGPTFFRSPSSLPPGSQYSFYAGDDLDLKIQNVAVWVVGSADPDSSQGVCFRNQVNVKALAPGATLVIVARAGYGNRGIWFQGGLNVDAGVQVYLVSDGGVSIVHRHDYNENTTAGMISIVAGGQVEIGGPGSGNTFTLAYDPSSMDALADQLMSLGALPEVTGGTGANFVAIRPSWVEITPR